MIVKFLESLRTKEQPLLGPIYWLIKAAGLLLPKGIFGKLLCVVIQESVTIFVITQYIQLFLVRDDINTIIEILNISSLVVVCVIKSNTMLYWQDHWKQALEYVTDADKFERETRNNERGVIVDRYTKHAKKVVYYYCLLVFFTNLAVILPNFLIYITSSSYRSAIKNGTESFPHIFSSWTPYDKNKFPLNWVTLMFHLFICMTVASIILAYDTTVVVLMVFFGAQFELLRLRCAELLDETEVIDDEEFDGRVKLLHRLHTQLMQNIRLVSSLLSPAMFVYVVLCGTAFCASAYQVTIVHSVGEKLMIAEYLGFGVAQLFLYCWIGNDVLEKSSRLMWGPYSCAWWRAPLRRRRVVLLLAGQVSEPYVFRAGPFTDLTLPTFVAIVKAAYSYFTLLRN